MRIGVPKEIKVHEYRVGMIPACVREAVAHGHEVSVQAGAAERQGISDEDYRKAGATILKSPEEVFAKADLIVKVKEPQSHELELLREGQTLFTYLHLAPDPAQAKALMKAGVTAIAYETVTNPHGGLPLLSPMSEVAGRMGVQVGAHCLEMEQGGRGMLLGGTAGVAPANVVVLGGGVAGQNAVRMAIGAEAHVTCIETSSGSTRSTSSSAPPSIRSSRRGKQSRTTCSPPTSSSARCWCRVRQRPSSSAPNS
jgi:alanine dehydrogenase